MVNHEIRTELVNILDGLSDEQVTVLIQVAKAMRPSETSLAGDKQQEAMSGSRSETDKKEKRFYTAEELIKMPLEERNRHVAEALELAKDEDFEIFEAYSEEDLDDYSWMSPGERGGQHDSEGGTGV